MADILIAGGYGEVGRRVAADLVPRHRGRVVLAGRNPAQAARLCSALGPDVRTRALDVRDPASVREALRGVGTVVSCIDQPERHLLHGAIDAGIAYTDVTPHLMSLRAPGMLEELHAAARRTGARVIAAAGIVPGISSVMARAGADRVGTVERVETALLLSAGDEFGPAALTYILEEMSCPFPVLTDGRIREAVPLTEYALIGFDPPIGDRRAWLFPFSDQVFYPATLGARTVRTRLALDPPWLGDVCATLMRAGASAWLGRPWARRAVARAVHGLHTGGRDRWSLVVTVAGPSGQRAELATGGHVQAHAAGVGAAILADLLDAGTVSDAGVWLPEQVVSPATFFAELEARAIAVRVRS
jgi:saccharopine dehydrogenase-like NADP-dependent oxidoreductase